MAEQRRPDEEPKTNINVFIRARPQRATSSCIDSIEKDDKSINCKHVSDSVKKDFEVRKFKFSHVFRESDNQEIVFKKTAIPILDSVIEGYNGCIMAYGQTGTGKTHTILGKRDGLLPKSLEYIFFRNDQVDERFVVDISCLQIYMENLTDLFDYKKKTVQIREKNGSFTITNSVWVRLNNFSEALKVIEETENRRKSCSTNMNQFSSRSHAIFIIKVTNIKNLTSSNLFLVDLAGSERIKKSYAQGDQLEEAISINTSLMALSKCIYSISENKWNHIPYRESKLTKVLQETLAGNGKTTIIITISPDGTDIEETISSLKFGQRASKIYCTPKICKIENDYLNNNMFMLDDQKKILEEENLHLREQCKKLLRIVETTSTKQTQNRPTREKPGPEEEALEVTKDLKNLLDVQQEPVPTVDPQAYRMLIAENQELRERIEDAELEAFDSMRLTYEDIENKLYKEIDEQKSLNKKQNKTINTLNKKVEELQKLLQQRDIELLNSNERYQRLQQSRQLGDAKPSSISTSCATSVLGGEKLTLMAALSKLSQDFGGRPRTNCNQKEEMLRQDLEQLVMHYSRDSDLEDKENHILSRSVSRIELSISQKSDSPLRKGRNKECVSGLISQNASQKRLILGDPHVECLSFNDDPQLDQEPDAQENAYSSASPEEKQLASSKLLSVLENLVNDIDKKCKTLEVTGLNHYEAKDKVLAHLSASSLSYAHHDAFLAAMGELQGNKVSLLKVALNLIVQQFVSRVVQLRFTEKQEAMLQHQLRVFKDIILSPELKDQAVEVIRRKFVEKKAALSIQRAYKKYKWRAAFSKNQRPSAGFDWGRVRAAMGKENLQLLLQDVEAAVEGLQKHFW